MIPFLTIVGCILFFEGIPYFLSPATARKMALSIASLPDGTLRRLGFSLLVSGLMIVYFSTRVGG